VEKMKSFYEDLRKEAELRLYPGCSSFTRFSFLVTILQWKSKHLITNSAFTNILQILREAFPPAKTLPRTYREAKAVVDKLGLGYISIHVCIKNCILLERNMPTLIISPSAASQDGKMLKQIRLRRKC
jgi:hypothetical protein